MVFAWIIEHELIVLLGTLDKSCDYYRLHSGPCLECSGQKK